jgi:hypothetical protein
MNEEVCIVEDMGRIVKYSCHPVVDMTRGTFTGVNYANWLAEGVEADKRIRVAEAWLAWEHANKVPRMVMAPYQAKMVPGKHLNLWVDPEIDPSVPSIVWKEFVEYLIPDVQSRKWLDQWIGHMIQRPGTKMATYAILVGPQGVGKTMLALGVEAILGKENCAMVGQEDLESDFNSLWATKLFTAINEFHAHKKETGNKLKRIVTETSTRANKKYGAEYMIDSVTNYMITTNELGALKLDEDDRRAAVIDCSPLRKENEKFFEAVAEEIRLRPNGILGYYGEVDLTGFNPYGAAVRTDAKSAMTEMRRTGIEQIAWRLANEPMELLEDLRLPTDLKYVPMTVVVDRGWEMAGLNLANRNAESKAILGKMGQALKSYGLNQWNDGKQIMVDGKRVRVYVINDGELNAAEEDVKTDVRRCAPRY